MTHENLSESLANCGEKISDPDARRQLDLILRRDRRRMKSVIAVTIALWLLTAAGIVALVGCALVFVGPWVHGLFPQRGPNFAPGLFDYLLPSIFYATIALTVVLLLAALSTVTLINLSRRATLRQINANLQEISARLKAIQEQGTKPADR